MYIIQKLKKDLIQEAFKIFYDIREVPGIKKKPSTSELIDWLKLLMTDDVDAKILREKDPKKTNSASSWSPSKK